MKLICVVHEYSEDYFPVEIWQANNGSISIRVYSEYGKNTTTVNLLDLIGYAKNCDVLRWRLTGVAKEHDVSQQPAAAEDSMNFLHESHHRRKQEHQRLRCEELRCSPFMLELLESLEERLKALEAARCG